MYISYFMYVGLPFNLFIMGSNAKLDILVDTYPYINTYCWLINIILVCYKYCY